MAGVQGEQLRIVYKQPCVAASTANITDLAAGAPDSLDGIALNLGDRVLVKDQSTGSENGIYVVDTVGTGSNGSWSRADDFDASASDGISAGVSTYVQRGSTQEKTTFILTTIGSITIGSTALTFEAGPTAGQTAASFTDQTNAVYVSENGNDSDDGLTPDAPKLTIGSAITAASGLTPGSSNRVSIVIMDGGTYSEDLTLPSYVSLIGPGATVEGEIEPGIGSTVHLRRSVQTGASAVICIQAQVAGSCYVRIEEIINSSSSSSAAGLKVDSLSTTVHLDVGKMEANSGVAIWNNAGGEITGSVGGIEVTGSGWGFYLEGGNTSLMADRLFESGTATHGVDVRSSGTANLFVGEFTTSNSYQVASSSTLNLFVGSLTGTPGSAAGTINVTEAGASLGGSTGSTDNAVIRADGTGGSTVQSSAVLIDDSGNLSPDSASGSDLGTVSLPWGDIHLGTQNDIIFGNDVTINGAINNLQFVNGTSYRFDAVIRPTSDGGASLGGGTSAWSDLFLDTGGVINFENGDVTITHSTDTLTFAGADSGYDFDNPLFLSERSAALADQVGKGQLWVRDDTPNVLVFTDDAGTDTVLGQGSSSAVEVVKQPCRVATSDNITLSGGAPDTVDGVSLAASDRILVWNQTTASENGIYEVTTLGTGSDGTWSRSSDFDNASADSIEAGNEVYVQEGDTYGRVKFLLTTTGAITIGSTSLEFIPMGGLVRTDASSTEIQASTAFSTTTNWTSSVNMRDHNEIAIFFDPTTLGTVTDVTLVIAWSDDGSTIAFSDGEYNQQSDYQITDGTDGSFEPQTYTVHMTTADSLVAGTGVHLTFPKRGGYCRIGVTADANDGTYTVRSQRLVV